MRYSVVITLLAVFALTSGLMPLSAVGSMKLIQPPQIGVSINGEPKITARVELGTFRPDILLLDDSTTEIGATVTSQTCEWRVNSDDWTDAMKQDVFWDWKYRIVRTGGLWPESDKWCRDNKICENSFKEDGLDVDALYWTVNHFLVPDKGSLWPVCGCSYAIPYGTIGMAEVGGVRSYSSVNVQVKSGTSVVSGNLDRKDRTLELAGGSVIVEMEDDIVPSAYNCGNFKPTGYYPAVSLGKTYYMVPSQVAANYKDIQSSFAYWAGLCHQSSGDAAKVRNYLDSKGYKTDGGDDLSTCMSNLMGYMNSLSTTLKTPAQVTKDGQKFEIQKEENTAWVGFTTTSENIQNPISLPRLSFTLEGKWAGISRPTGSAKLTCPTSIMEVSSVGGGTQVPIKVSSVGGMGIFNIVAKCGTYDSTSSSNVQVVEGHPQIVNLYVAGISASTTEEVITCRASVAATYGEGDECEFRLKVVGWSPCGKDICVDSQTIQRCSMGQYRDPEPCPEGQVCVDGRCQVPPQPGEVRTEGCASKYGGFGTILEDLFGACGVMELFFFAIMAIVLLFILMMFMNLAG
jgi:hypothetical protein